MRLILHPGHSKCGSSSIQSFIYSNIEQLKALKIYVPDANFRFLFEAEAKKSLFKWNSPLVYFREFINDREDIFSLEERLQTILKNAHQSDCESILISSENLVNLHKKSGACRKIHKVLSSYFSNVTIIYYIRRQDDFLISSWQQWRHKEGKKLKKYIFDSLNSNDLQFLQTAKFFEDIYGANNLQVIPLHKEALVEGKLITDFCHRAQINIGNNINYDYYANPSLNPHICDILARIPNIYLYHLNENDPRTVHENNEIKQLLNKYVTSQDLLWNNDKMVLDEETKATIMKHFGEENRQLHKKYFSGVAYEKVFGTQKFPNCQNPSEYEIEKLKDVVAIQMEIILNLLLQKRAKRKS